MTTTDRERHEKAGKKAPVYALPFVPFVPFVVNAWLLFRPFARPQDRAALMVVSRSREVIGLEMNNAPSSMTPFWLMMSAV
jgi:hypothetical protein